MTCECWASPIGVATSIQDTHGGWERTFERLSRAPEYGDRAIVWRGYPLILHPRPPRRYQKRGLGCKVTPLPPYYAASIAGHAADDETARWVADLGDQLRNKLAAVGLIPKREAATLAGFIDSYIRRRQDVKASTATVYGHTRRNMIEYFGKDKPLREVFEDAEEGAEFVITRYRSTCTNLRTQLTRIINRRGYSSGPSCFRISEAVARRSWPNAGRYTLSVRG